MLRGVSDLLQNLQDGLTLAQVAFPQRDGASLHLKLGLPSTTARPTFMFASRFSKTIQKTSCVLDDEDSLQIGSFVQQMDG